MAHSRTSSYLRGFRWYRRSRLWVVPAAGAAAALLLASVSLSVDHFVLGELGEDAPFPIFVGTPETVHSILTLIGTAIATLTALVLTIVAVVIQLATQDLSPRAVRTFLQDAHSHLTIGTFVTTFTYALVVLQQFDRIAQEEDIVASTSMTLAFLLAVVSLGMFISYVDHIVHQSRVTSIIDLIGNETRHVIEQMYPPEERAAHQRAGELPDRDPDQVIRSPQHGVILEIDVPSLVRELAREDAVVVTRPAVGDFIPCGDRLFEVYGGRPVDERTLSAAVELDAERSIMQDVPFGFRLLIDIAQRALSPGVNDPTTATQVVDQLHDLLRLLGSRPFPNGWHGDEEGVPRLFIPQPAWHVFVALAFEEIRYHGGDSLQVVRRLRSVADNLIAELPDDRHPPLHRQLQLLDQAAERGFPSDFERAAASYPDAQGIGSGGGFDPAIPTDPPDEA